MAIKKRKTCQLFLHSSCHFPTMITPTFSLEQDDVFVTITIHAPYIRAQEIDMFIAGDEFKLYVKPYFLRLHLPGNIIEDDRASADYDIVKGNITAKVPKETPGQYFPDLDLLPKLLARRGETVDISAEAANTNRIEEKSDSLALTKHRSNAPLIEVLSEDEDVQDDDKTALQSTLEEAEAFDWQLPQSCPQSEPVLGSYYGFNQQYQGLFVYWSESGNEVNEIEHPEQSTIESRREERINKENDKFDDDYYIADFMQKQLMQEEGDDGEGEIHRLIKYRTRWWDELRKRQKAAKKQEESNGALSDRIEQLSLNNESTTTTTTTTNTEVANVKHNTLEEMELTAEEEKWILELPSKRYIINNEKSIYLGLVDIMFAYSYDHRISEGELTVESAWTICKLSATLSSLEVSKRVPILHHNQTVIVY
ncbi:SHQ1 protein-domain-containing protein [Syncephalis plumigaleata]|nr:SHQ1 protein-domain-containing protein [Syncephalis plumigaleata]